MPDDEKDGKSNQGALVSLRDLLGVGQAVDSLIGAIKRGVGPVAEPILRYIDARQKRNEYGAWVATLGNSGLEPKAAELNLGQRTELRVSLEAARQQDNREAVAVRAVEEFKLALPAAGQAKGAKDPPSPEWLDRFWRLAQDI